MIRWAQWNSLHRTGDGGENIIRVRSNEPNGTDNDHQNHSQHNGIFSDVLASVVSPKLGEGVGHGNPFNGDQIPTTRLVLGPKRAVGAKSE